MTTIRSNPFPQAPLHQGGVGTPRDEQAKLAAQRAFFAAAMSQGQAASAPAAPAAPAQAQAPAPVQRVPTDAAEAPQRILRPGSLLDIRV